MAVAVHLLVSVRQAANASLASEVIPFATKACASAGVSATSSALLFRAFTDSKEVPIAEISGSQKGLRETH